MTNEQALEFIETWIQPNVPGCSKGGAVLTHHGERIRDALLELDHDEMHDDFKKFYDRCVDRGIAKGERLDIYLKRVEIMAGKISIPILDPGYYSAHDFVHLVTERTQEVGGTVVIATKSGLTSQWMRAEAFAEFKEATEDEIKRWKECRRRFQDIQTFDVDEQALFVEWRKMRCEELGTTPGDMIMRTGRLRFKKKAEPDDEAVAFDKECQQKRAEIVGLDWSDDLAF